MKNVIALLLIAFMCLSFVACGDSGTNNKPQTNESVSDHAQQETTETADTNEVDWTSQVYASEWYCVGSKMPGGMVFNSDGTMGTCTWELIDNKLILTTQAQETITYEIRTINNIHFLVGLDDGISYYQWQSGIDWNSLPITAIEITIDNWQDYLEVVNVSNDTGPIYHLKLKNAYRQAVVVDLRDDCDSRFSVCYSQGEEKSVARDIEFYWDGDYIIISNPTEFPLEVENVEGTIYVIDGLL